MYKGKWQLIKFVFIVNIQRNFIHEWQTRKAIGIQIKEANIFFWDRKVKLKRSLCYILFFSKIILYRDIDEKLIQNICSEVTDWLLVANVGDCFELAEIKNMQNFIIHKELRNRFDSIWTQQEDSTVTLNLNSGN